MRFSQAIIETLDLETTVPCKRGIKNSFHVFFPVDDLLCYLKFVLGPYFSYV